MVWLLLTGCELAQGYLTEVREDPSEVTVQGWLYDGPSPEDEEDVLSEGVSMVATDDYGELLGEGYEPFEDSPGYWAVDLPVGVDYQLRIDGGEGTYPAVWRGVAPHGDAYWPRYALFAWPQTLVDDFMEELAEVEGIAIHPLSFGDVTHVWGVPYDPEAVTGDSIRVEDGSGQAAAVLAYTLDEETGALQRTLDGPITYFFAFNLTPGAVVVTLEGEGGAEASEVYLAEGGDLITAWYFVGP